MVLNIAVCEDEHAQRMKLEGFIATWGKRKNYSVLLHSFPNAEGLLKQLKLRKAFHDLFLMDISLPGTIDGFALAEMIRQQHKAAELVFITTSDRSYQRSHALAALDYLIKPVNASDIEPALDFVAARKRACQQENIPVRDRSPSSQGWHGDYPCSGIISITRRRQEHNTASLVCLNNDPTLCVDDSLVQLLELNSDFLARPSDSCLLSMLFIKRLTASTIIMRDDKVYRIMPSYASQFQDSLQEFFRKQTWLSPLNDETKGDR